MTELDALPAPRTGKELEDAALRMAREHRSTNPADHVFAMFGPVMRGWKPVAYYADASGPDGGSGGDGCSVVVEACALPAIFYRIVPQIEGKDPVALNTGADSEIADLVVTIARAMTTGMLGVQVGEEV